MRVSSIRSRPWPTCPIVAQAALRIVTRRQSELAAQNDRRGRLAPSCELDALVDALKRSASAARSFRERLEALGELTKKMFDAMEFEFSLQPGAPTSRDRVSGCGQQPRFQLL